MKPVRLVKGFLTVGFWTLVSRVAGLVRDIFLARYLGDGTVALQLDWPALALALRQELSGMGTV